MQTIIHFNGLCRSGNHAIIFWIIHNLADTIYFCGDKYNDMYCSKDSTVCFCNNVTRGKKFSDVDTSPFKYLIRSYEDTICTIPNSIYLIRDFLNTICSRYKKWGDRLCPWVEPDGHQYYSDIYDLILGWKKNINEERKILYNSWLANKSYRNSISDKLLNIPNIIDNIAYISDIGDGSSFSGTNPIQNKTALLNRFSQIKLPANIIDTILQDSELLNLNLQHFNIDIAAKLKEMA